MYLSTDASQSILYEEIPYGWVSDIFKAAVWDDSGAAYADIRNGYNVRSGCVLLPVPDPRYCVEDLLKI